MSVTQEVPPPEALKVYTGSKPLPPINTNLLRDLVLWATQSYAKAQGFRDTLPEWAEGYADWAKWGQGSWGYVDAELSTNGSVYATEFNACGTSFCLAGNAAVQLGYQLLPLSTVSDIREWVSWRDDSGPWSAEQAAPKFFKELDKNGHEVYEVDMSRVDSISVVAQRGLGITHEEADHLFDGSNSIGHVIDWAMRFAAIRGKDLDLPEDVEEMRVPDSLIEDTWYAMHHGASMSHCSDQFLALLSTKDNDHVYAEARRVIDDAHNAGEIDDSVHEAAMDALN